MLLLCYALFFLVNGMHNKCNACNEVGTQKLPCLQLFKCNKSVWSYSIKLILTCIYLAHNLYKYFSQSFYTHAHAYFICGAYANNKCHAPCIEEKWTNLLPHSYETNPRPHAHVCISCNASTYAEGDMHIVRDYYLFNSVILLQSLIYAY